MKVDETRGIKIWLFANGDVFNEGKRMVVSTRVFKNFEQFLLQVSRDLNLLHGAVRKVYTMEGGEITSLAQLRDGRSYVAISSAEQFAGVDYRIPEKPGQSRLAKGTGVGGGAGLVRLSRKPILESATNILAGEAIIEKEPPIFTSTSKGYRVIIFLNGNDKIPDLKLVINYRNCKSIERFLATLSQIFQRRIRKIYDAETYTRIKTLQDLKNGQNIVAGSEFDPLQKLKYPIIDPLATKSKEKLSQKVVTFYPNGDAYHHGYQLTVKQSRYHNVQLLLDHLNSAIHLVTGRATRIYNLETGLQVPPLDPSQIFATSPTSYTKFVLVSGDDMFYNIKYDMNAYKKLAFGEGAIEEEPQPDSRILRKLKTKKKVRVVRDLGREAVETAAAKAKSRIMSPEDQELDQAGLLSPRGVAASRAKTPIAFMSGGPTPGAKSPAPALSEGVTPRSKTPAAVLSGAQTPKSIKSKPITRQQTQHLPPDNDLEIPETLLLNDTSDIASDNQIENPQEPRLQEFETGEFKEASKQRKQKQTKKQSKVKYDGQEVNVEELPPLPLSMPMSPMSNTNGLAGKGEFENLPPLPVSRPMSSPEEVA